MRSRNFDSGIHKNLGMGNCSTTVRTSLGPEFPRCRTWWLWYVDGKLESVDRQKFACAINVVMFHSPAKCMSRRNALRAAGPLPSPPTPSSGMRVACGSVARGFVVLGSEGSGSGNQSIKRHQIQPWPAGLSRLGSQVLPGSGTLRSSPAHNGRNTICVVVEHDRPPADDRRRGDVMYSGTPLECVGNRYGAPGTPSA